MNAEVCLDANVFAAFLSAEPEHELCLNLFSLLRAREFVFYEPALVGFEVTSILRKKVRIGAMTRVEAIRALELFSKLPLLLRWQTTVLNTALRHANELALKNAYDMSYVAVAKERNIPCVTFDRELRHKGRKLYGKIVSVEDYVVRLRQNVAGNSMKLE